jgi:hypothetical protein
MAAWLGEHLGLILATLAVMAMIWVGLLCRVLEGDNQGGACEANSK